MWSCCGCCSSKIGKMKRRMMRHNHKVYGCQPEICMCACVWARYMRVYVSMKYDYYANRLWCSHKNMLFASHSRVCVCVRASRFDSGHRHWRQEVWVRHVEKGTWGGYGEIDCVIAMQGRRAYFHSDLTHRHQTELMPKRKIIRRQWTSYEMRCRTIFSLRECTRAEIRFEWEADEGGEDSTLLQISLFFIFCIE